MPGYATLRNGNPLLYLPRRPLQKFSEGDVIYDWQHPCGYLYLLIEGHVKLAHAAAAGQEAVVGFVSSQGLFGESCLSGERVSRESAVALDAVLVVGWTREDVVAEVEVQPQLGLALAEYLARRCSRQNSRIASLTAYGTGERLRLALADLVKDFGIAMVDGTARLKGLPQQTLAEYIGTSREIISQHMNELRRKGVLQYSRKFIDVNLDAFQAELRDSGVRLSPASGDP